MTGIVPQAIVSRHLRNLLHSAILIAATAILAGGIAWLTFGVDGLVYAGVSSAIGIYLLSHISPQLVLTLYNARRLRPDELPEVQAIVADLAAAARLPAAPRLYYVPSQMLNSFAVGNRNDCAIAVTDGLLRAMTLRQIAGILAHEISHVRSGDLRVMGLADVLNRVTGLMSMLGLLGVPFMFGNGWHIPLSGLLLLIFAPTIGGLLQLALSRTREYDADLDGVALTGDPEGLASALALLERRQSALWERLMLPGARIPDPSLLRTHPRTADRIARLMQLQPQARTQGRFSGAPAASSASITPVNRGPRSHWLKLGPWY